MEGLEKASLCWLDFGMLSISRKPIGQDPKLTPTRAFGHCGQMVSPTANCFDSLWRLGREEGAERIPCLPHFGDKWIDQGGMEGEAEWLDRQMSAFVLLEVNNKPTPKRRGGTKER